jgi:N-ethylmaleimide reductase
MKECFKGVVMGNIGYTRDTAEKALASGYGDLIAFGRLFMSNPDLVERFKNDWPLAEIPPYEEWWDMKYGKRGYVDYPVYGKERVMAEIGEGLL